MRMRRRMMQRPFARGWALGPAGGGRDFREVRREALRRQLELVTARQERLQEWLDLLDDEDPDTDPQDPGPPDHPGSGSRALRHALFEIFDELVDPDSPTIPRVAAINRRLEDYDLDAIQRKDALPVFERWLADMD